MSGPSHIGSPIDVLTRTELQRECRRRDLPTAFSRMELIHRLKAYDRKRPYVLACCAT